MCTVDVGRCLTVRKADVGSGTPFTPKAMIRLTAHLNEVSTT